MATALDYSAGRPRAAAVRDARHDGVIRYVGTPGRTKNITRAEYADMVAAGRGVALVYENHAGDAAGGYAGGQAAARAARADADAIGFPADRPVYFAVDSDQVTRDQFTAVMAYLDGAASILGGRELVGVYGEFDVIEMAVGAHARYGWQTAAWSTGKHSTKAALYQRLGQIYVGGIQVDVSDILAPDWGQHNAPTTRATQSAGTPGALDQEDTMATAPAGTDEHLDLIVKGKTALYLACSWNEVIQVHAILFYGDTGDDLHGTGVGGAVNATTWQSNRPGPVPIPPDAAMATVRYTATHSFAVGAV
ncbi:glycoside hydrolase domain-containing protein [Amycolatopsis sp. H20-H5]|uniref:glycoside hydrolase domain-containing protein n=1 Tax=Amycolatopsis sp. H20-H5 TaxID=3046309 RepID=UPI002DB94EF0|nr:glycoside hydrolase domain-containing protein [Amycolatopsis sp. H20-H5]MEC3975078.1 glycoside hydrolase domain-containing protein [Amycolatopsis sp. H20-H5]